MIAPLRRWTHSIGRPRRETACCAKLERLLFQEHSKPKRLEIAERGQGAFEFMFFGLDSFTSGFVSTASSSGSDLEVGPSTFVFVCSLRAGSGQCSRSPASTSGLGGCLCPPRPCIDWRCRRHWTAELFCIQTKRVHIQTHTNTHTLTRTRTHSHTDRGRTKSSGCLGGTLCKWLRTGGVTGPKETVQLDHTQRRQRGSQDHGLQPSGDLRCARIDCRLTLLVFGLIVLGVLLTMV